MRGAMANRRRWLCSWERFSVSIQIWDRRSDSALTIIGASAGEATITLITRDPDGNEASAAFDVRVVLALAPEPESTPTSTLTGVVGRYDANGDGRIDRAEYLQATHDYDAGDLTILEMLKVMRAYLAGQG